MYGIIVVDVIVNFKQERIENVGITYGRRSKVVMTSQEWFRYKRVYAQMP